MLPGSWRLLNGEFVAHEPVHDGLACTRLVAMSNTLPVAPWLAANASIGRPIPDGMAEGRMTSTTLFGPRPKEPGSGIISFCSRALALFDMCGARQGRGIALGEVVTANE